MIAWLRRICRRETRAQRKARLYQLVAKINADSAVPWQPRQALVDLLIELDIEGVL